MKPLPQYRRFFFASLLYLSIVNNVWAQEPYQAAKVIPPSPTAASLGKYGDFQVSYYTGSTETTIPLYDIKIGDNILPIKLSYNSTGVKVGEVASWAGLGWTLSAGGVIIRTIRGLDDLGNNGYYTAGPLPPNNGTEYYPSGNWAADRQYFDNIHRGYMDAEPDIYNYNFGNYTGRFSLGKKADGSKIFMDERNNLKVEYTPSGRNWIVTDGHGYRYYFNTGESATEYTYSSTSQEVRDNATLSDFRKVIQADVTTAWYLDSIVAPSADRVKLTYAVKSHSVSQISKYEKKFNVLELSSTCSPTPSASYSYYNANRQVIYDVYLQQISFNQGTIDFNTTDREDIEYVDANKPDKLSEVVIKNFENKTIKKFVLSHSYFNPNSDKRLKLDSITEYGSTGQSKPPYKFSYFDSDNIPPKYSKSIDHWGYYNSKGNNTLIPETTVPFYNKFFAGADRDGDTLLTNLRKGVMSSVVYPTGGSTQFEYELNNYSNLKGDDRYKLVSVGRQTYAYDEERFKKSRDSFDIPVGDSPTVTVRFNYDKYDPDAPDLINPNIQVNYAYIYRNGQVIGTYSNYSAPGTSQTGGGDDVAVLRPGHYIIESRYIQGYVTSMSATWENRIPIRQKTGGGLRIKSIANYQSGVKTNVRKFLYNEADSTSGRLVTKPAYQYSLVFDGYTGYGSCPIYGVYLGQESGSVIPPGLSSGAGIIGYSKVTELMGENGEGGKTEYYYYNNDDVYTEAPFIPAHHDPLNGKLKTTIVYNAAGKKVRKTEYTNLAKEIYTLKGFKLYGIDQLPVPNQPPDRVSELSYSIRYYELASNWFPLQSEIVTEYSNSDSLVTLKTYNYENFDNKKITRKEENRSDGKTVITKYKYPGDYPTAGSGSFVSKLKQQHIISPVIEEQAFIDNGGSLKVIGGRFTEYKEYAQQSGSLLRPGIEYRITIDAPSTNLTESSIGADNIIHFHPSYKPEVYFDRYNALGNLETYHKINNVPNTYMWDYKSALPVAQIENAGFSDVAYTSFEAEQKGNWSFTGTPAADATAPTGKKSYNLANGAASRTGLQTGKSYMLSYWAKSASAFSITGTQSGYPVKGKTVNGWTNYVHKIAGVTSITFPSSGVIDELRLYPADARMNTYTYVPLIGIAGSSDAKNQISYYEYDDLGRLRLVRDQDDKIIKQFEYQYQSPLNAIWQTTGNTRCLTGTGGYLTGVIEREEKDVNPNSTTYGTLRWVSGGQSASCPVTADWKTTGNTRCQAGTGGYLTGKGEREERDMNPYSSTYNTVRWVETGTNSSCAVVADWKPTGNNRCISGTGGYLTGRQEIEQKDMNSYSASYNTTRWLDNGSSTSCPVNPDWRPTGNTRCQYVNNAYTGHQEREERDMNPYTSTSGSLRWTDTGESSSCSTTPRWTNTGIDRCMVDAWNSYTGVVEVEQRDTNPYSTTYNTIKWVNTGLTGNCPLPPDCLPKPEYRAVNNVCESGTRIGLVESEELTPTKWRCTYWVSYSYGPSEKITVFSSRQCSVPPPPAKSASH